jgi:uncharacterized damage-inducible protein DinB
MTGRPTSLAERFQRATQDVIEFVNGLSDDQWRAVDEAEGLSIGAMVHHLAAGDRLARTVLEALVQGADRAPHQTEAATEDRERLQAQEAAEFAHLSRAETIEMLRRQGADVARTIRSLSDAELERVDTFWGESIRTREFIERWIDDIGQHLAEIRVTADKQSRSRT